MNTLIKATLALLLVTGSAWAQPAGLVEGAEKVGAAAKPIAQADLQTVGRLASDARHARALGFAKPADAKAVDLGAPFVIHDVGLNRLRDFDEGADPGALLGEPSRVLAPILREERAVSAVLMRRADRQWRVTGYGRPALTKLLAEARARSVGGSGVAAEKHFVVAVPALNQWFLAVSPGDGLLLTPLVDDAQYDFARGKPLDAKEAFGRLARAAKRAEDLPR